MPSRLTRDRKELLKLEVLKLIKENNNVLFGYCKRNDQAIKAKEDGWTVVLRKAQSIGLAPNDSTWKYARDRLFSFWKTQLTSKQKRSSISGKPLKMTKVDEAIIEIVAAHPKFCREHQIYQLHRDILARNNGTQGPQPGGDNTMVRNRQWQVEHPQPDPEMPIHSVEINAPQVEEIYPTAEINAPQDEVIYPSAEINYPNVEFAQVLNEALMVLDNYNY